MEAARKGLALEMEEDEPNQPGEEEDEKENEEAPQKKLAKSDIEEDELPF